MRARPMVFTAATLPPTMTPEAAPMRHVKARLVNALETGLQVKREALTRDEAEFIASSGYDADGFRDRALAAARRRGVGSGPGSVQEGPASEGVMEAPA